MNTWWRDGTAEGIRLPAVVKRTCPSNFSRISINRRDYNSGGSRINGRLYPRMTLNATHWAAVEQLPEFRALVRAKRAFILPATLFFVAYYFALPVLVGYFPEAMSAPVLGRINVAYLFALSQFVMAWTLMALYVLRARRYDAMAEALLQRLQEPR